MKKRLLPSCFSAFFLGISLLLFSHLVFAATPDVLPGSGDDQMNRIRNNQVTGTINPADVMKARAQFEKLTAKSGSNLGLNWQALGPDNFSGRSRAVLFDNTDPAAQTIYTGGVTGGLYRSINMGLSWLEVATGTDQNLRVSALAQKPSGTIFIGTGEMYCGSGSYMGTGLYRTDDGVSFSLVASAQPVANDPNSDWAFITKLAYDANGSRLYALTNKGIRYSENDGVSWVNLIDGSGDDIVVGSNGTFLASINDSVYVAVGGNLSQLTNVSTGTATMLPNINVGFTKLAIAPSDPNILYASIARASDNFLLNVYRSNDQGASWYVIFPANPTFEPFLGSGCYSNTLAVFPNDPNQIILGGSDLWWGKQGDPTGYFNWAQTSFGGIASDVIPFYAPYFHHDYMFRPNDPANFAMATDNGVTIGTIVTPDSMKFQTSNKNLTTTQFVSVANTVMKNWVMGGGIRVGTQVIGPFTTNTPQTGTNILGGTGTNCAWSSINPNVVIYGIPGAASITEPYFRSDDLGTTPSPTGFGGIAGSQSNLPILLWESFNFGLTNDSVKYIARDSTLLAGTLISVPSANAKFPMPYVLPETLQWHDSIRVPDVVQSRFFIFGTKNKTGIWMTKQILQFSVDPEWFQVAQTDPVTCMTLSPDMNYLYAGTETGKLYRVSNLELANNYATADLNSPTCIVATEAFTPAEFTGRYITSIAFSQDDNNTVLVTLGNYGNSKYVYLTQNALDSLPVFTSVQGDLPAMPVYSSLFEASGANKVILGTDFGVFTTDNVASGSVQWGADMTGIGNTPVVMLRQQTINYYPVQNLGAIYAASYGKGLFQDLTYYTPLGIDPGNGQNPVAGTLKAMPNPFRSEVTLTYTLEKAGNANLSVYDLAGKPVYRASLGFAARGEHTSTVSLGMLNAGTYIVTVNDSYAKVVKVR
jgi:hypothetical protein